MPFWLPRQRAALFGGGVPIQPPAAYSFTNAEASALVARMATPPSNARTALIDTLIGSLKSGATSGTNIWAKLDVLYVLAAADSQAALLDWRDILADSSYDAFEVNAPAFTVDRGYAGDGATPGMCLDTAYTPGISSLGMTNADCHFGAFLQNAAASGIDIGQTATTWFLRGATGALRVSLAGSSTIAPAAGNAPHHIAASRTGSTSAFAYRNGVAGAQQTTSSTTALSSNSVKILGAAGSSAGDHRVSAAHVGKALNAAEHLDLYNALQTYMTAVGA